MCRFLFGAIALGLAAAPVAGQHHGHMSGSAYGSAIFGPYAGGFRPPLYSAPILPPTAMSPAFAGSQPGFIRFFPSSGFGFRSYYGSFGYPYYGYGFGGGFFANGYNYSPYARGQGVAPIVGYPTPPLFYIPQHIVQLSGEFPAKLTLEFPYPARAHLARPAARRQVYLPHPGRVEDEGPDLRSRPRCGRRPRRQQQDDRRLRRPEVGEIAFLEKFYSHSIVAGGLLEMS
jgi:hypothetical protein